MPTTNYDVKQLNFSIDRILSKDVRPNNPNESRHFSLPISPVPYSYAESYKACDVFDNNISRPQAQCSISQLYTVPDNFGHIFRNRNNIIRPEPLRPIPKESIPTTSSGTRMETTNCRRRSWSRAVFSSLQRKGLEKRFALQKYITKPDRRQLAATLGLTDAQVKVWFQNRRMKWRHMKEDKKVSPQNEDTCKTDKIINSSASAINNTDSDVEKEYCSEEDVDIESNI